MSMVLGTVKDNMALENSVALPFAPRKQAAIVWYLSTNPEFFEHARTKLRPQWFGDHITAKIYDALLDFYDRFQRLPSKLEWVESPKFTIEEPAVRSAMKAAVETALNESRIYGLDVLKTELTEWLRAFIYKTGMEASVAHFQRQEFSQAYKIVADNIKTIQETSFEGDGAFDFSNLAQGLEASEARVRAGCTFGLQLVDNALCPEGISTGGLFQKDITCLMAPANIGKTTAMISVICANIILGKRVLFFTHEGNELDIRDMIVMNLLQSTKRELWNMRLIEEGRKRLKLVEALLKKNLTYFPWVRAQMSIEELIPVIRKKCYEAQSEGFPYSMLADDYPALLLSTYGKQVRMEYRNCIEQNYTIFSQLANELGLHALVNIQVNREGSKANRDEDRLLDKEDVAECWGAMQRVTNVITINRSPSDMIKNRLTYLIAKSRSSATGKAIVANTAFNRGISHSNKLGGCWYWGSKMIPSDELDQYMVQFKNSEITSKPNEPTT